MECKKLTFPTESEYYLKYIFEKNDTNTQAKCGSVFLKKGDILPFKVLGFDEISFLLSGKLIVCTKGNQKIEMNNGDLIYIHKNEIRETQVLEDSQILFFLYQ